MISDSVPVDSLAVLGLLLFFGLLLPRLFKRLHLPFATSLILVGSATGPHGLGLIDPDPGLVLFGFLGATFQMLLAGTETHALRIRSRDRATRRVILVNALLPAASGVAIARAFDYGWTPALFVGIVFLSSSILLVFSMVGALGLARTGTGRLLKRISVVEDLTASVLAFVLFRTLAPHPRFPLAILAGLLLSSVIVLRMFLPEVVGFVFSRFDADDTAEHEDRLRFVIALMLLIIFAYAAFDVHPVIAAFLVGFTIAEVPAADALRGRLQTLGYALFIPVFLFVVGLDTDLTVLVRVGSGDLLALSILTGAVGSKVVGGYLGGRWAGLDARESTLVGVSSTVRLTVPLSATYAAQDLGILDTPLFSAIVVLSVVSSILAPLLLSLFGRRSAPLRRPKDSARA